MSLQSSNPLFVPEETARVVKAIYRKGGLAIHLRDELIGIYRTELFADLYPNLVASYTSFATIRLLGHDGLRH